MNKVLRIIGLITGLVTFLGSGFYFVENSFDNLFYGNMYINISTGIVFIFSLIGLYFIWNSKP
ncbi:Uncharacterised protein [Klebsiella grimontii]|jgi:hypothetical protein|nr:Uncharacterised protein [Klebsiella grimontii]DAW89192.1 MAG TPA: hypothetical protein [Caudoviricetes sp.]